ncbi:MAG: hypothetical protein JXA18_11060 [Chitinispirillaceae bacterium]|nr:hypothetical protein [Chitinispirillaceae bacterium]
MPAVESFERDDPHIEEFRAFTASHYAGDPFYRGSEDPALCPCKTRCFLCREGDCTVGRAAAIVNPDLTFRGAPAGCTGFFECVDDPVAVGELLATAGAFLRDCGCRWNIGPLNGSTWYAYRATEPSGNPPFFLDNYHKPWYASLFRSAGFDTIATYSSTRIALDGKSESRVERLAKRFDQRGIIERTIDPVAFDDEVARIHALCLESFAGNFLYTPATVEEVIGMYRKVQPYVDPTFVRLCEDIRGELLAFVFCLPDLYNRTEKTLVIKTVAVKPGGSARGLGAFLVEKIHSLARQAGFRFIIHALMHDSNQSMLIANEGSQLYHRYSLFAKALV